MVSQLYKFSYHIRENMVTMNFTEQWQKMSFWNFRDANLKWVIHKNLAHWLKMLFDNCIDNSKSFEHLYSYEQQFSPVTESRIEIGIKIWWQLQLVADNCLFAVSTFHYIWPRMNQIFAGGIEPNWRVLNPNLHSEELRIRLIVDRLGRGSNPFALRWT